MTWLPWLVVLLRHAVVAVALVFVAPEHAWRKQRATLRAHWEARP